MPQISDQRATATTVTVANIITGNRFEFPPAGRVTRIRGGIVSDVASVVATFSIGERIVSENYIVPIESAVGVVSRDRDYNWVAVAKPGERIVVSLTNNNAGTATTTLLLELS